jgi:NAD(P)-dependent dehydrogenase (short-subunit alcohol dehydrogenase family)
MQTEMRAAVTGAGSGIGAATARLLKSQGWKVAWMDRDLRAVAGEAGDLAVPVDVADEQSVIDAFAAVRDKLGGLEALATAAGVIETTPFFDTTPAMFRRLFDINVIGVFLSIREAAKLMRAGGRICTVASVASLSGGGFVATGAYAASKGGALTLMKSAARALGPRGIAVNAVAPGLIDTPFVGGAMSDPAKRSQIDALVGDKIGKPEQIAQSIVWLMSPLSAYVHGATLVADGGLLMH